MSGERKNPFPWTALFGSLGGLGSSLLGYFSNRANVKQQEKANEQNIALTRESNAMQLRESEKAYQRSLPTNQVANYRAAGMSHAGALQALSGGGAYSPAPVNTAQVDPVQGSSAGAQQGIETMVNAIMQQQSNNTQYRIAKQQLDTQRAIARENNKTSLNVAKIQQEGTMYGADKGLEGTTYQSDKNYESSVLSSLLHHSVGMANVNLGYEELEEVRRQYNDMSPYNKRRINQEIAQSKAYADLLAKQAIGQKWENSMNAKEYRLILDNWQKISENAGLTYDNEKLYLEMQEAYHTLMRNYYSSPKSKYDTYWQEEIKLFSDLIQTASQFYIGSKLAGKSSPKLTRSVTTKSKGRTVVNNEYGY